MLLILIEACFLKDRKRRCIIRRCTRGNSRESNWTGDGGGAGGAAF